METRVSLKYFVNGCSRLKMPLSLLIGRIILYIIRNSEAIRVLKLCAAADLVTTNTYFTTKCDNHILTYRSGNACSQIH